MGLISACPTIVPHHCLKNMNTPNPGESAPTQEQREAIVDALHFCMYADNRLVLAEDRVVRDWLDSVGWDSPVSRADYLDTSLLKVRLAKESLATREQFVAAVSARLRDESARSLARRLCQSMISADGISSTVELNALAELRLDEVMH